MKNSHSWKSLIISKGTLKRAKYVYFPIFLIGFLLLTAFAFILEKPSNDFVDLDQDLKSKVPIVYSPYYNIEFLGLEEFHHFDSKKYGRVYDALIAEGIITPDNHLKAGQVSRELLELTHGKAYLESIQNSWELARISELGFLRFFPSRLSRNILLVPKKYQSGGSVLAAKAALEHGWAINLGGGFHHASTNNGEGFCVIADISMIVKYLRAEGLAQKFMIVDFDAHQGNGHGLDFIGDDDVYILDAYNKEIYPNDTRAKEGIDLQIELPAFVGDNYFLPRIEQGLKQALSEFEPELIIYAAGTDILTGDPLGALEISREGVIKRDEILFSEAAAADIPIVMLLSGGYQKSNAEVIAASIVNLIKSDKN